VYTMGNASKVFLAGAVILSALSFLYSRGSVPAFVIARLPSAYLVPEIRLLYARSMSLSGSSARRFAEVHRREDGDAPGDESDFMSAPGRQPPPAADICFGDPTSRRLLRVDDLSAQMGNKTYTSLAEFSRDAVALTPPALAGVAMRSCTDLARWGCTENDPDCTKALCFVPYGLAKDHRNIFLERGSPSTRKPRRARGRPHRHFWEDIGLYGQQEERRSHHYRFLAVPEDETKAVLSLRQNSAPSPDAEAEPQAQPAGEAPPAEPPAADEKQAEPNWEQQNSAQPAAAHAAGDEHASALVELEVKHALPLQSCAISQSHVFPLLGPTQFSLLSVDAKDVARSGQTIFISATTYRDQDCKVPLITGFNRAKHPERLYFGVVYQIEDSDLDCAKPDTPCGEKDAQGEEDVLCKWKDHIRFFRTPASEASGPTYARHLADKLYDKEDFALQIDGHMHFAENWDDTAITEWESLDNDKAVLTTYVNDIACFDDPDKGTTTSPNTKCGSPFICQSEMKNPGSGMFRHHRAYTVMKEFDTPMMQPFLGAGLIFSKGHRYDNVINDCCTPLMFDGEEFTLGARLWTNGYDFYSPNKGFVLHPYHRQKPPSYMQESSKHGGHGEMQRSVNRARKILGLPIPENADYNAHDIEKYQLGKERPLSKFLEVFGVDTEGGKTMDESCQNTFSGALHKKLTAFNTGEGVYYDVVPGDIISSSELK